MLLQVSPSSGRKIFGWNPGENVKHNMPPLPFFPPETVRISSWVLWAPNSSSVKWDKVGIHFIRLLNQMDLQTGSACLRMCYILIRRPSWSSHTLQRQACWKLSPPSWQSSFSLVYMWNTVSGKQLRDDRQPSQGHTASHARILRAEPVLLPWENRAQELTSEEQSAHPRKTAKALRIAIRSFCCLAKNFLSKSFRNWKRFCWILSLSVGRCKGRNSTMKHLQRQINECLGNVETC